jgi:hypothetical protein
MPSAPERCIAFSFARWWPSTYNFVTCAQIFIAQVARKADEKDLFAFFSDCGKVNQRAEIRTI